MMVLSALGSRLGLAMTAWTRPTSPAGAALRKATVPETDVWSAARRIWMELGSVATAAPTAGAADGAADGSRFAADGTRFATVDSAFANSWLSGVVAAAAATSTERSTSGGGAVEGAATRMLAPTTATPLVTYGRTDTCIGLPLTLGWITRTYANLAERKVKFGRRRAALAVAE